MIKLSLIKQRSKKSTPLSTNYHLPSTKPGFTIVELLVVIVVIGILAAITIVSYAGISQRAVAVSLQSDLASAKKQLQIYQTENDAYPDEVDDCPTPAAGNLCLDSSGDNEFTNYSVNNSTNPPTFTLDVFKGDTTYRVTDDSAPVAVVVTGPDTFVVAWGGAAGNDYGYSVAQTGDDGFVVTGETRSYGAGGYDMFLAKYSSDGTLAWSKTWGGIGDEKGSSVVYTGDGGFAVTGETESYGAGSNDMFLAKYTSDGTLSWSKTWGGTSNDYGKSLVQTGDGGFAVTGETVSYGLGGGYLDMFLAKYTSDGTLSWSKTWGGGSNDGGYSLVQTSDGGFAVTGDTLSFTAGGWDMFLAKYTSDGTLSWSKRWGGTGWDYGYSVIQTSDDGFAVTGSTESYGAGAEEMFLAKYVSDGTLSWSRTWGGAGWDEGHSVIQTNDSGYAVTGWTDSYGNGNLDIFLAKYDLNGALSWSKTWGGTDDDFGYSLVETSDGGFAVAGEIESYGAGMDDMSLAKYDSDGTITNCSSPMCQSPTATVTTPSPTVASPTASVTTPSPTVTTPSPTVTTPSPTTTVIVAP